MKEGDGVTVDTVRLLVEHGAGVSMKGNDGITPVPGACESGQVDTVGLLMEHDADVNVKGVGGGGGGDEVTVNAVGLLVEHNPGDVNVKTNSKDTPVPGACESGDVDSQTPGGSLS